MAMAIREDCIDCGSCEPACPNDAISGGENIYLVDSGHCTECVGAFDTPQCVEACPIPDCIQVDPQRTESREVLQARYLQLHGG